MVPNTGEFARFGVSRLWSGIRTRHGGLPLGTTLREARRTLRQACPPRPGVYGMVDADGELIYVGKSKSLRNRLLSYLQTEPADPKAAQIIRHAVRLVWETTPHELTALLRELELIRRFCPRFNVSGQPGRFRRVFVAVGRGPAPYAFIARELPARAQETFGPVPSKRILRDAVQRLNVWFHLRDCPDRTAIMFADQLELFPRGRTPQCLRFELGTCPAPCAGVCTSREYAENLHLARAFLAGTDVGLLTRLRHEMQSAAEARQFERAADLRDAWQPLAWLHDHLELVRHARQSYSFVYTIRDYRSRRYWLVIREGQLVDGFRSPEDSDGARRSLARLNRAFWPGAERQDAPRREDLEAALMVAAWFRRHPAELDSTMPPADAKRICLRLARCERGDVAEAQKNRASSALEHGRRPSK